MDYIKTYSTSSELIELLERRGLFCKNINNPERLIQSIGYYRLSGYLYPFLSVPKSNHIFKNGSSLFAANQLYEFDRKLRQLVFDAIERIEVAVRSAIVNITCSELDDVFWMTKPEYFARIDKFEKTISLINKEYETSHEDFIVHYKETYDNPYPPSWMIAKILPFGVLTRIYDNIACNRIRKRIAQYFGLR